MTTGFLRGCMWPMMALLLVAAMALTGAARAEASSGAVATTTEAAGSTAAAGPAKAPPPPAVSSAPPGSASAAERAPLVALSASRVGIALALVALMGGLFYVLFTWQHEIEQSDFFSGIYTDAAERFEYTRLAEPTREKWRRGDYLEEIFLERSARGRDWIHKQGARPAFPGEYRDAARNELGRGWEIEDIERSMRRVPIEREGVTASPVASSGSRNPFGMSARSRLPGLGGSSTVPTSTETGQRAATDDDAQREAAHQAALVACSDALERFRTEADQWIRRADAQAREWYQADLKVCEAAAGERAKKLLNVDFSALRGRGPEFVLEFTAVVVIIFSAVILGVLGVLDSNQIGTLLAAIAGYVLGKGTSRGQAATPVEITVKGSGQDDKPRQPPAPPLPLSAAQAVPAGAAEVQG